MKAMITIEIEMPTGCNECQFNYDHIACVACTDVRSVSPLFSSCERAEGCPLVEVIV